MNQFVIVGHSDLVRGPRRVPWLAFAMQVLGIVSLSGWLHLIWNGEPRLMLVDDQGVATRLLIDEALARPFGGIRALNGKRVAVTGERASGPPEAVRVRSIELGTEKRP